MALSEQQRAAKAEYEKQKAERAKVTMESLKATETSRPTPTQEENDLTALGLMDPDDKADPSGAPKKEAETQPRETPPRTTTRP